MGVVQRHKIDALGLANAFAVVVISSEVALAKPDRRIDTEAARAAGLRGFWLDLGGRGSANPARPALLASAG